MNSEQLWQHPQELLTLNSDKSQHEDGEVGAKSYHQQNPTTIGISLLQWESQFSLMMSPPGWSATCGFRPYSNTRWVTYKLDTMGKEKRDKKSQSWVGRDRKVVMGEGLRKRRVCSKYAVSNSQRINKSVDKNEDGWLPRNSTHGWHVPTHAHVPAWTCIPPSREKVLQISPSEPTLTPVSLCSLCSLMARAIGNVLDSLLPSFD